MANAQQDAQFKYDKEECVAIEDETSAIGSALRYLAERSTKLECPFRWPFMADWADEQPFTTYHSPTTGADAYKDLTLTQVTQHMYKKIKGHPLQPHTCKPSDRIYLTPRTIIKEAFPDYLRRDLRGYKKVEVQITQAKRVLEISQVLHGLLPQPKDGLSYFQATEKGSHERQKQEFLQVEEARQNGAAIVAREIMLSHPHVILCLPIRFNQMHCLTSAGGFEGSSSLPYPQSFALWLKFSDQTETILPLAINIIGGRTLPFVTGATFLHSRYRSGAASGLSWDDDILGQPLQERFNGFPVLHISDCNLLHSYPLDKDRNAGYYKDQSVVAPRVYSSCWYLENSLTAGSRTMSPIFGVRRQRSPKAIVGAFPTLGISRFTSPRALIDEVRRLGCTTRFKAQQTPRTVFKLISLNSFSMKPPIIPPRVTEDIEHKVDSQLTCGMSYECIAPRTSETILCAVHLERVKRLVESDRYTTACLDTIPLSHIRFFFPGKPRDKQFVNEQLSTLFGSRDDETWAMDAEGLVGTKAGIAAIPTEFAIVNCADASRSYSEHFYYNRYKHISHMIDELKEKEAIEFRDGSFHSNMIGGFLSKNYRGVKGKTFAQHGQALSQIRFNEDAAVVVQWGSTKIDAGTLGRILRKVDTVVATREETKVGCPTINLLRLYQLCTNLGHPMSLSEVWTTFNPGKDQSLIWHTAKDDALATVDLLRRFKEGMLDALKLEREGSGDDEE